MDEGTLNDLLECSVCLERLDTSSKVLPCQHTFCKKCLEEIVLKHKELRCPECRVLVRIKVEDLPPNVLLMRILEGMRNAGNAVVKRVHRTNRPGYQLQIPSVLHTTPIHQQHGTPDHRIISNKQSSNHILPHQPYAIAAYDYSSKETCDLSFKRGDIITLRKRIDNNWYQGECGGKTGVFPLSYVQIITPVPSNIPQCKALYEFRMSGEEEEGCLAFCKGDIVNVIRRVDENWAEGKLDGRVGIFPLAFVELNELARSLMKLSTNAQPGPSRLAPPTPTSEDSSPLIPTDHTRNVVCQRLPQQQQQNFTPLASNHPLPTSDSSSTASSSGGGSSTPNATSSGSSSSGGSTAPSSPASPPPRGQNLVAPPPKSTAPKPDILLNSNKISTPQRSPQSRSGEPHSSSHHKEKRHSFTGLTSPHNNAANHNRHSAEILASDGQAPAALSERSRRNGHSIAQEVLLPATYIALFSYKPQKSDELELRKGGIYMVTERCQDGWYKGTSNRTQKCGVFPGNYVTLARTSSHSQTASPSLTGSSTQEMAPKPTARSSRSKGSVNGAYLKPSVSLDPPELPPRAVSPATSTISSSWHGQQESAVTSMGNSTMVMSSPVVATLGSGAIKSSDKNKDRKEKGTVSLMRRLTSIRRSKSPPPTSYSMDNPVFEDTAVAVKSSPLQPVHVRSGSCPSQLLQLQPNDHHRLFGSTSQRHKHKERPSIITHCPRTSDNPAGSSGSSPDVHRHRKSNSLDASNRPTKTSSQTVRERFRCIAPYPPNSEYELELQVNDIIYVHKKRDDGWFKGTQQRTGKTGLFPASFVDSYP